LLAQRIDLLKQVEEASRAKHAGGQGTWLDAQHAVIAVIQADLEHSRAERIALRQR